MAPLRSSILSLAYACVAFSYCLATVAAAGPDVVVPKKLVSGEANFVYHDSGAQNIRL